MIPAPRVRPAIDPVRRYAAADGRARAPTPADGRAVEHRHGDHRRRHARHERRRACPLAHREGRLGAPVVGRPRRAADGHVGVRGSAGAGRSRRLDRGSWADARRPDARGDRRGLWRATGCRSRPRGMAAAAVGATRDRIPRAQPQASVADPLVDGARQPERHRARLVRQPPRRPADRRAARTPARDATDVVRRGHAAARGHRSRATDGRPDVPVGRDRRIAGR